MMIRFEIDDISVVNWSVTVSSFNQLSAIPRMITDLTINYNKARQAAITQELVEIVSGANAAKG